MRLLIDDMREIEADAVARDSYQAYKLISRAKWDEVYLDHDLGEGSDTGYQVMNWWLESDYPLPHTILIVSSNPVGRDNIGRALVAHGYHRSSPFLFQLPIDNVSEV